MNLKVQKYGGMTMKKASIEIGSIVQLGLNEFKVIASRNKMRYKLIVNEVGYIRSAINCQTNTSAPLAIRIEFFEPVETAMIQFQNGFFMPINLTPVPLPPSKKASLRMVALCKKKDQLQLQRIEGAHTNKKGFVEKLRRQGFIVKHVYIS